MTTAASSAKWEPVNWLKKTNITEIYKNSDKNENDRPSAECRSDHNLVMDNLEIKLKQIRRSERVPW